MEANSVNKGFSARKHRIESLAINHQIFQWAIAVRPRNLWQFMSPAIGLKAGQQRFTLFTREEPWRRLNAATPERFSLGARPHFSGCWMLIGFDRLHDHIGSAWHHLLFLEGTEGSPGGPAQSDPVSVSRVGIHRPAVTGWRMCALELVLGCIPVAVRKVPAKESAGRHSRLPSARIPQRCRLARCDTFH
jgi:hypothetical protein